MSGLLGSPPPRGDHRFRGPYAAGTSVRDLGPPSGGIVLLGRSSLTMRNRTDTASLSTTALSFDTRLGRRGHRTLREDSGGLGENTTLKNPAPGKTRPGEKPEAGKSEVRKNPGVVRVPIQPVTTFAAESSRANSASQSECHAPASSQVPHRSVGREQSRTGASQPECHA